MTELVSIVVPTYNNEDTVARCLRSLAAQTWARFEVLLVNDGSTDRTLERARAACAGDERFRVFTHSLRRGAAAARNVGLRNARGQVLAFIDADCWAEPDWLARLLRTVRSGYRVCAGGPDVVPDTAPLVNRCIGYSMDSLLTSAGLRRGDTTLVDYLPGTGNMALSREVLDTAGLFDETFHDSGEDKDFLYRARDAGWKMVHAPDAIVWHHRTHCLRTHARKMYLCGLRRVDLWSRPGRFQPAHFAPALLTLLLGVGWAWPAARGIWLAAVAATLLVLGLDAITGARHLGDRRAALLIPLTSALVPLGYGAGILMALLARPLRRWWRGAQPPGGVRRILFLSPFASGPLTGGVLVRIDRLVRHLAERHRVWLVCRGGARLEDALPCPSVPSARWRWRQVADPVLVYRLARKIRQEGIDTIFVSSLIAGIHGVALKLLTGCTLVFDDHNAEFVGYRRRRSPLAPLVQAVEWLVCRAADSVVCVSEVDRDHLCLGLGVSPGRIQVVPNGTDPWRAGESAPNVLPALGLAPARKIVLFFGVLTYEPNAQAVRILLEELAPRLQQSAADCQVVVAGGGREEFLKGWRRPLPPNVTLTGFVEDLRGLIECAHVVVAPIVSGSGTRMKLLEAAACGRKSISTTLGAEGLDREAFGDLLVIRDGWDTFHAAVLRALSEPPTSGSRADILVDYDWAHVLEGLRV